MDLVRPFYKRNVRCLGLIIGTVIYCGIFSILLIESILEFNLALFISAAGFLLFYIIGISAYLIVAHVRNSYTDQRLQEIPGFSSQRFLRECTRSPQISNLLMTSDAVCYVSDRTIHVIPLQDIIWAYQTEKAQVSLMTRDHNSITIPAHSKGIQSDTICRYLFRLIRRRRPGAFIGYNAEWEKMAKQDFNRFVMTADQQSMLSAEEMEMLYIQNNLYVVDFA